MQSATHFLKLSGTHCRQRPGQSITIAHTSPTLFSFELFDLFLRCSDPLLRYIVSEFLCSIVLSRVSTVFYLCFRHLRTLSCLVIVSSHVSFHPPSIFELLPYLFVRWHRPSLGHPRVPPRVFRDLRTPSDPFRVQSSVIESYSGPVPAYLHSAPIPLFVMSVPQTCMPLRYDDNAPTFDPSRPTTIRNYFEDIEELLGRCQISDNQLMKRWTCRYEPLEHTDRWKNTPKYSDPSTTFAEFKAAIFALYPGADGKQTYVVEDLELLVDYWRARGVRSASDYSEFYQNYSEIATTLVKDRFIGERDSASYIYRALSDAQVNEIQAYLRLKHPDQRHGHDFSEIHEAALWFFEDARPHAESLRSPSSSIATPPTPLPTPPLPPSRPPPSLLSEVPEIVPMKRDKLVAVFEQLSSPNEPIRATLPPGILPAPPSHVYASPKRCHYCDELGHVVLMCPKVLEDELAGLIIRVNGRILLPTGRFLSRVYRADLPDMHSRVVEWHREHHAQHDKSSGGPMVSEMPPSFPKTRPMSSIAVRIESLEREILALQRMATAQSPARAAQLVFLPEPRPEITRVALETRPKTPESRYIPSTDHAESALTSPASVVPTTESFGQVNSHGIEASRIPPSVSFSAPELAPCTPTQSQDSLVQKAVYCPPTQRVFGARPSPAPRGHGTPVKQSNVVQKVFERSLNTAGVTLTHQELLAIAPDIARKYQDHVEPVWKPPSPTACMYLCTESENPPRASEDLNSRPTHL